MAKLEIIYEIMQLLKQYRRYIPKGYLLLDEQNPPQTLDEMFQLLINIFSKEEEAILRKQRSNFVTDDYENNVRQFAVILMKLLLPYHKEWKNNKIYRTLCRKRHAAYGYVKAIDTMYIEKVTAMNVQVPDYVYLGLAEFYNNFYGTFFDNQEAIELLCKFYPQENTEWIKEHAEEVSSALFTHVSNAGTPNDTGYAYRGIERIEKYIGMLPLEVVEALLKEYPLYHILYDKVYRHQVYTIINYAKFDDKDKKILKFWYLDSLLIANSVDQYLFEKWETEETKVEDHNNYYDYRLKDEELRIMDDPEAYWGNILSEERVLFFEGEPFIKIQLQGAGIYTYGKLEKEPLFLPFIQEDWQLNIYSYAQTKIKIRNLIFETEENIFNGPMLFSLAYLDNYRGLQNQVIDFDHRFTYDSEKKFIEKNTDAVPKIPHIYGKSVYSLSCIVGKNATGKTSIMDFLRETFFGLLKLINERQLNAENGYVEEEEYKDYNILDSNAKFLVVFSFGEKNYFLTNIAGIKQSEIIPFGRGSYNGINELSKAAYFSNQLRNNQPELLVDEKKEVIFDEEKRIKQDISKTNSGFRQVNYSEAESFIRKRKAVDLVLHALKEPGERKGLNQEDALKECGVPDTEQGLNICNKEICYQLSFLKNFDSEKIGEVINITNQKEFHFVSHIHGEQREMFTLEKLKARKDSAHEENGIIEKLERFIKLPDTVMKHFSAGQYTKFIFLAKLCWFLRGDIEELNRYNELVGDMVFSQEEILLEGETALIFIDEGEIYYHPEWQRRYIKDLLEMVNAFSKKVQIVITTNSPFIISDILHEDITYLTNDKVNESKREMEYTLGQNIHKLLRENFFMEYTIGEYARELIENIMTCLQEETGLKEAAETEKEETEKARQKKAEDTGQKLGIYFDEIEDYYDAFDLLIEQIGEPVYKYELKQMLEESSFAKNRDIEKQIRDLEEEKRMLQEKIDKLKEEK